MSNARKIRRQGLPSHKQARHPHTEPHLCKPGKDRDDETTHHPYLYCKVCGRAMARTK